MKKYTRNDVINIIEDMLQSPDVVMDAMHNEDTNTDAEDLLEMAEAHLKILNVLPKENDKTEGTYYAPLFELLQREHDVLALDTELSEIVTVVKDMLGLPKYGEKPNAFDVFARMNKKDAAHGTQTLPVFPDFVRANAGKTNAEIVMGTPAVYVTKALVENGKFILLYYTKADFDTASDDLVQGRQI